MSYRCEACLLTPPAGTPSLKIPVKTRNKVYPPRKNANRLIKALGKSIPDPANPQRRLPHPHLSDPGGEGWEIVSEMTVCPSCAEGQCNS